eukprot:m.201052 g.201052  ORF g.201052 m.201052 type:complete len:76 (+) comp21291_c0_seq1:930-1157(+)
MTPGFTPHFANNTYVVLPGGEFLSSCGGTFRNLSSWQAAVNETGSQVLQQPKAAPAVVALARVLLGLPPASMDAR